jgi:hypothetical protein
MTNFPDGNQNLGSDLDSIVWAGYYVNDVLKGVSIKSCEVLLVTKLLAKIPKGAIGKNHDSILCTIPKKEKLNVYNIDAHHDCWEFEKGSKVHCGNWLTYLKESKRLNKVFWVNPYPDDDSDSSEVKLKLIKLKDLNKVKFDWFYICHSPAWSPPHLDYIFLNTFGKIYPEFNLIVEDRWLIVERMVHDRKKVLNSIKKELNKKGDKDATDNRITSPV